MPVPAPVSVSLPPDVHVLGVYAIPLTERFRGIDVREGVVLQGPAGTGEFCPFAEYGDEVAADWLATALEACTLGWPAPVRDRVTVNCTVPAVDPARAFSVVAGSGCSTAKVKVAEHPDSLSEDLARVEAVRSALDSMPGPAGSVRVDANGRWDVDVAVRSIKLLDDVAGGLEYVEQPCANIEELAAVRRRVDVRIAADESIRLAADPVRVAVAGAADVAVIKCTPLGGVRRSLEVAQACGLPCVVSSALESSVGLAAQLALAGALPSLDFACGLGTLALLDGDTVTSSLRPTDGSLPVVRVPPAVTDESLEAVAMRDPVRVEWWTQRLSRAADVLAARGVSR